MEARESARAVMRHACTKADKWEMLRPSTDMRYQQSVIPLLKTKKKTNKQYIIVRRSE